MNSTVSLLVPALGLMLVAALLFWPQVGLLALWRRRAEKRRRVLAEDALKHLHNSEWRGQTTRLDSLAGALRLAPTEAMALARRMETAGWLRCSEDNLRLTPEGEQLALSVIRAHRLWERYLADEARMPLAEVHAEAERREHLRSPQIVQALDAALGHPATDPHGDPIPTAEGELAVASTKSLADWPLDTPARIAHLEDEPAVIFDQIAAIDLRPGTVVRVMEAGPQRLVVSDGERVHTLAPVVAANIFVTTDGVDRHAGEARPLSALRPGRQATVHALADSLQGFTRRRLLDLGLTPGVTVTAELTSLFGDPMAYRVRGTLIALRRDQAEQILIKSN
jgi:DtxR family Mn-dependent transcriptional regulator